MANASPILVKPDATVSEKVNRLKEKLHTSRGGFALLALEFALPKIEAGELVNINGKLVPVGSHK